MPKLRRNAHVPVAVAVAVAVSASDSSACAAGKSVLTTKPAPAAKIAWMQTQRAVEEVASKRAKHARPIAIKGEADVVE